MSDALNNLKQAMADASGQTLSEEQRTLIEATRMINHLKTRLDEAGTGRYRALEEAREQRELADRYFPLLMKSLTDGQQSIEITADRQLRPYVPQLGQLIYMPRCLDFETPTFGTAAYYIKGGHISGYYETQIFIDPWTTHFAGLCYGQRLVAQSSDIIMNWMANNQGFIVNGKHQRSFTDIRAYEKYQSEIEESADEN